MKFKPYGPLGALLIAFIVNSSAQAQDSSSPTDWLGILLGALISAIAFLVYWLVKRIRNSKKNQDKQKAKAGTLSNRIEEKQLSDGAVNIEKTIDMAVFVSYRRNDSADVVGRIYDRLVTTLGADNVFKDVDAIPIGVDFRVHLSNAVQRANIVLAVIGPRWTQELTQDGKRRIDDERDYVHIELSTSLERSIPVVPVLVSGAQMPSAEDLPVALADLAYRNAVSVRPDPDFHTDLDRLIRGLEHHAPKK